MITLYTSMGMAEWLIQRIYTDFYESKGFKDGVEAEIAKWSPESMSSYDSGTMPDDDTFKELFRRGISEQNSKMRENAGDLVRAINLKRDGDLKVKTRIFNKGLLESILNARQSFLSDSNILISSWGDDWKFYEEFIEYRNKEISDYSYRKFKRTLDAKNPLNLPNLLNRPVPRNPILERQIHEGIIAMGEYKLGRRPFPW